MRSKLKRYSQDEWAIEALHSYLFAAIRSREKGKRPYTVFSWLKYQGQSGENYRCRLLSLIETAKKAKLITPIPSRNGRTAYIWVG